MNSSLDNLPIGIIDSGVGGLSVWQQVTKLLPYESTVYIADQKYVPYGARTDEEITRLTTRLVAYLSEQVKLIVIACNTISVTCLDTLRSGFPDVPIIGTVPVIKLAVQETKTKRIGVLSTQQTAQNLYQKHLIHEFAKNCEVINHGTNNLVPYIERGEITTSEFKKILADELMLFKRAEIDVLVLGCTHFPFIRSQVQEILGSTISILDSGQAVARQVKRVLSHNTALAQKGTAVYDFYTTGNKDQFTQSLMSLASIPGKKLHMVQSIRL